MCLESLDDRLGVLAESGAIFFDEGTDGREGLGAVTVVRRGGVDALGIG